MERAEPEPVRRSLVEIAIETRTDYRKVYDRALRGELGTVERVGSRIYVVVPQPAGAA
jgi:hypothetical protein